MGKLDNTLIIYIAGDNGTSAEGTPIGTPNELASINGILDMPVEDQLKLYDVWGSDLTYAAHGGRRGPGPSTRRSSGPSRSRRTSAARGRAWCMSWPGHIKDMGGVRTQFHHVIDIVPTILEATGIQAPETVDGIAQKPIEGVSMAYTFDSGERRRARRPARPSISRWSANRGIYNDGWYANTTPPSAPLGW